MAEPVPPRRGQRVKSAILPNFNGGNAFACVQHHDGRIGIVHRRHGSRTTVWFEHDLVPTMCSHASLTAIDLVVVPEIAYREYEAVIGGVGKHVRWQVILADAKQRDSVTLRVSGVSDIAVFREFVANRLAPFASTDAESDGATATVTVPDASHIGTVAAALHTAGFDASVEDGSHVGKLAPERYDRSPHMWWNQDQRRAGPLRDVHRWDFSYLPEDWTVLPFTWQAMCQNIQMDPLLESSHLPRPLRDFYLTDKIHAAEAGGHTAVAEQLCTLRGEPAVTSRLSQPQNRQLLGATYWSLLAPFDSFNTHLAKLLRFRYMLHGYTAREMGEYKQTARNLGHGATIRRFNNKPQYKKENLSAKVLERICQRDGTMRGSGFKGTRGKYGHRDFPKYEPSKRMQRTAVQECRVRRGASNPFEEYRKGAVEKHQGEN